MRLVWVVLIGLLWASSAEAVCSGASPTWTAVSAGRTDVGDCYTAAAPEDTINVPAGSASWSTTLTMTKGVKLIGAGSGCPLACNGATTITNTTGGSLITYVPATPTANQAFRLSGFTFDGNGGSGPVLGLDTVNTNVPQTKVRIDHNRFQNQNTTDSTQSYIHRQGLFFGLVDHSYTIGGVIFMRSNLAGNEDFNWWRNVPGIRFGAADNNFYFEDNWFNVSDVTMDCIEGFRYAMRYNVFNGGGAPVLDLHGNNGSQTGCFGAELYGNDYRGGTSIFDDRGGITYVHHNTNNVSATYTQIRDESDGGNTPIGTYIGPGAPPCPVSLPGAPSRCQDKWSSYYWANRVNLTGAAWELHFGGSLNCIGSNCSLNTTGMPFPGVDFFYPLSSPPMTEGTLAARPATCAVGQGYWATTQSTTDLTGMVGIAPATPISGILYKCTATNIWNAGETLLPYPHPLIAGTDTTPPNAPTGVRVD